MRFGPELRRLRLEAGLSLTELSRLVHYSKSHLSKIETGAKRATVDFARRCDAVLDADGALARLAAPPPARRERSARAEAGDVWLLRLAQPHRTGFATTVDQEATVGDALPPLTGSFRGSVGDAGNALDAFRDFFAQTRAVGQLVGPATLVPVLVAQTHAVRGMGANATGADRAEAFRLAAHFADYTGWMVQESGNDAGAAWWTDRAVEFAVESGDDGMAAHALVRRALIAMYAGDGAGTVALAAAAQAAPCRPRIRGLAAQRKAQGYALVGDHTACFRALDEARALLSSDPGDDGPAVGSTHVADPVSAATGWALHDLGRPREAAATLTVEIALIPPGARRAWARFSARKALALAASGQVDEACVLADRVIDANEDVRSATIGTDLRALAVTLRRWHRHPSARRIGTRLNAVLHP